MNNKDLLDAIDELDTKYVTAAWENTQPPEQRAFRLGGAPKRSVGKIISAVSCAAAAIAAVFLTARFIPRIGRSNAPAVGGVTVESSEPETYSSPDTLVPPDTSATSAITVPGASQNLILYAPDDDFLYCSSNNEHTTIHPIVTENGNISTRVIFDNFAYLAEPMNNYNNVEQPDFYTNYGINRTMRRLYDVIPSYKRFLVGDKYGDLTVKKAETTFTLLSDIIDDTIYNSDELEEQAKRASYIEQMNVEFEGTTTIEAMIIPIKDIGSGYFAVPLWSEKNIPAVCPIYSDSSEEYYNTIRTAGISSGGELSEIQLDYDVMVELNNPKEFSLDEIIPIKGVMVTKLTLSDVTAEFNKSNNSLIKASIVEMDLIYFVNEIRIQNYDRANSLEETINSYNNMMYGYNVNAENTPNDLQIIAISDLGEDDEKEKLQLDACGELLNRTPNRDYAEFLRDYRVELRNGYFYYYRMAYDPETELWTVVKAMLFNGTELGR